MDVVIHGHFYQPPRENPWTGVVPRQPSAAPAHDWNARITDECYRPNARSRVLGASGSITDIVNNYAFMNFDFGPTLLTWLERNAPGVYRQIIEGDRISQRLQSGHGNAIAHAYNHVILPLASYRDKRTQIAWGLRDFEWRFGRRSESIWLAETAVNLETIRLLIEFGIRYIILSPYQALRARPLERAGAWSDARGGRIDPQRPYRFFLKDARRHRLPDRHIDVFFYDGPLASDVSFNHLLRSAPGFADRIVRVGGTIAGDRGLVSLATDGEVYGHHEPFGDMCLSYLIKREAPARGLRFVNYGQDLDLHPPAHEVELDFGENDEGTAWSCTHGVGRWERHCGCATGGQPGWNQKWRTPLRRGLDTVRDRLVETFLEQAIPLVKDPWAARDDYILVRLDPSERARAAYLEQHARRPLDEREQQRLWSLLESQRYAMYMYTSCGWFFADISGIETIQNLAYAARAIELARPWQTFDVEQTLLDSLADATSNVPEQGTGADIYRRLVGAQRVTAQVVAGDLALAAAVLRRDPEQRRFRYEVVTQAHARSEPPTDSNGHLYTQHSLLELRDCDTQTQTRFEVHVYCGRMADFRCYVQPVAPDAPAPIGAPPEAEVAARAGGLRLGLTDLVAEGREGIIRAAYESILEHQDQALTEIYEQSRSLMTTFRRAGVPVPVVFEAVAVHALARMLEGLAQRLEVGLLQKVSGASPQAADEIDTVLTEIAELLKFSRDTELELSIEPLIQAFGVVLERLLESLLREPNPAWAHEAVDVIRSSYDLHFALDRRPLEDLGFLVLRKHRAFLLGSAQQSESTADGRPIWQAFVSLAEALNLDIRRILDMDEGYAAAREGEP